MRSLLSNRRQIAVLSGLFGALLVVLLAVPQGQERLPRLTVYSASPDGGKALRLWLERLGYGVSTLESRPYRVPREARTVLVLAPSIPIADSELDELERWMRDGGTLLLAADGLFGGFALERFGFALYVLPGGWATARPLSDSGLDPLIGEVLVDAEEELELKHPEARPLVADGEHVFVAEAAVGEGRVIAISAPRMLSNRALHQEANARLALSLVGGHAPRTIVFDELHHGYGASEPRNLTSLLLERAWGRAALLASVLALLFLALHGRRFGCARPLAVSRGRSLAEYVASLAALYRVGDKRPFIAEHFERRCRRELANALGLPGDASDEQISARAEALGRDGGPALARLRDLGRARSLSDGELIRTVAELEEWVLNLQRPTTAEARG